MYEPEPELDLDALHHEPEPEPDLDLIVLHEPEPELDLDALHPNPEPEPELEPEPDLDALHHEPELEPDLDLDALYPNPDLIVPHEPEPELDLDALHPNPEPEPDEGYAFKDGIPYCLVCLTKNGMKRGHTFTPTAKCSMKGHYGKHKTCKIPCTECGNQFMSKKMKEHHRCRKH